jgi:hypothetical protein
MCFDAIYVAIQILNLKSNLEIETNIPFKHILICVFTITPKHTKWVR